MFIIGLIFYSFLNHTIVFHVIMLAIKPCYYLAIWSEWLLFNASYFFSYIKESTSNFFSYIKESTSYFFSYIKESTSYFFSYIKESTSYFLMSRWCLFLLNTMSLIFIAVVHWHKSTGGPIASFRHIMLTTNQTVFSLTL